MKYKNLFLLFICSFLIFIGLAFYVLNFGMASPYELSIIKQVQIWLSDVQLSIPIFITDMGYGIRRDFIVIFVIALFLICKKFKEAIIFFCSLPFAEYLYSTIKLIIERPRPPMEMRLIDIPNYSFPSGHSIMSMVLYGLIIYFTCKYVSNKTLRNILVCFFSILILSIGFTRIWLGVHFPSDVFGGFSLGICVLCLCIALNEFHFKSIKQIFKKTNLISVDSQGDEQTDINKI